MAEVFTYDTTTDSEVLSSIASDEAESLAIGEEMEAAHEGMLAGKYRDAAELEKAYIELEKKLGTGNYNEEPQQVEEEYDSTDSDDYGVEFLSAVNEELALNGELSEETLALFDDLSSRDLFNAFQRYQEVAGSEPQGREMSDQEVNQIQNMVGGANNYNQLTAWAADNFSAEEIEAFDSLVDTGNSAAVKLALQALQYRYTDAMGYEGEMIQGKPARSQETFRSQAELVRAMSDSRYDTDPAYRQDVIEKLERSDLDF